MEEPYTSEKRAEEQGDALFEKGEKKMTYVLVTVSAGIIDQVAFFDSVQQAIRALADFVKGMNSMDDNDAAVFGLEGLVANAKNFLDENDQFIGNSELINELVSNEEKSNPVYIIGNPVHWLGFMVVSSDDPIGYEDPVEAVSELGQMRKDAGNHLKLYQVIPVERPVIKKVDLERYIAENEIEDFEFPLVEEYVGP
jgi:hypothetical protein